MIYYQRAEMYDELMHQTFQEDFEIWTKDDFSKANRDITRLLRESLRKHGCFVASDRNTVAKNLELALNDRHEWTNAEIDQQVKRHKGFLPLSRFSSEVITRPTAMKSSFTENPGLPQFKTQALKTESLQQPPLLYRQSTAPMVDQIQISRQITDLMKIYSDDSKKYSGEKYDFLSKKLEIFYDFCNKI